MRILILFILFITLSEMSIAQSTTSKSEADTNVIAVVLKRKITTNEKNILNDIILGELLLQYAIENNIKATENELEAFVNFLDNINKRAITRRKAERDKLLRELESKTLSDERRKKKENELKIISEAIEFLLKEEAIDAQIDTSSVSRKVAQSQIFLWKVKKSLYAKYGGRVIFQQIGAESLDAYRDFLKEQEKKGAFKIIDKQYEAFFWQYYTTDSMHQFYEKNEGSKLINTPIWIEEPQYKGKP